MQHVMMLNMDDIKTSSPMTGQNAGNANKDDGVSHYGSSMKEQPTFSGESKATANEIMHGSSEQKSESDDNLLESDFSSSTARISPSLGTGGNNVEKVRKPEEQLPFSQQEAEEVMRTQKNSKLSIRWLAMLVDKVILVFKRKNKTLDKSKS